MRKFSDNHQANTKMIAKKKRKYWENRDKNRN